MAEENIPGLNEDGEVYTFNELYDAIAESKDLILTVPKDQVELLKKGLSMKKTKENAKLKNAGVAINKEAFEFIVYENEETKGTENTKVRIKLGPRTSINVLKMEIPDDSL